MQMHAAPATNWHLAAGKLPCCRQQRAGLCLDYGNPHFPLNINTHLTCHTCQPASAPAACSCNLCRRPGPLLQLLLRLLHGRGQRSPETWQEVAQDDQQPAGQGIAALLSQWLHRGLPLLPAALA